MVKNRANLSNSLKVSELMSSFVVLAPITKVGSGFAS
jgi:hypothetical protein